MAGITLVGGGLLVMRHEFIHRDDRRRDDVLADYESRNVYAVGSVAVVLGAALLFSDWSSRGAAKPDSMSDEFSAEEQAAGSWV